MAAAAKWSGSAIDFTAATAMESDHETLAPGQVPETVATPGAQEHRTVMDSSHQEAPPPYADDRGTKAADRPAESMAAQEEIQFPQSVEHAHRAVRKTTHTTEQTTYDYDERDFDNLDPKDYGIDFQEDAIIYEPPDRDDALPDLHRLMASLEEEGHHVGVKKTAPSLFAQPENVTSYRKITHLRTEIEEADIDDYLSKFDEGVREDVLMIGSIGLDDVQDEEKRLRDEHISYLHSVEAEKQRRRQQLLRLEELAKSRVARDVRDKRSEVQRREQLAQQQERLMLDRLQKAFRRAENQLVVTLDKRKGEIKRFYGDLMTASGHYGGTQGRRWKVDWDKTPQPIQIKVNCLRGVKDKLPGGRYVLMVSLYNRLGGHVMRWSNLKGQQWGGATLPVVHDGHFYNVEMKVDQSVFTVLPAKPGIRPGMVLMFEVFLLRGAVVQTDRVVGWGCFPIADGAFDVVEGKYKCPILRGEMDHRIDKHETLERLMASDLDHWLSNLYFEIVKLPRYLAGQKEYEVELQFSSGILAYPDRVNTGEEYRDGEAPVPGSLPDLHSNQASSDGLVSQPDLSLSNTLVSTISSEQDSVVAKKRLPVDATLDEKRHFGSDSLDSAKGLKNGAARHRRPMSMHGSRTVNKENKVKVGDDSNDTDYDDDDVYLMKKEKGLYLIRGQPGMYYKKHEFNPVDEYHKKMFSLLPRTPLLNRQKRKRRKLTHLEQLQEHTFSVKKSLNSSEKGRVPRPGMDKVQYVQRQLLAELGLSQWRSREFWGMLMMFCLIFFVRIYIHYISQWILLQGLEIPVNKFDFLPYTVNLNYQNTLLRTREEIGMVLLGPCGNILLFLLLVVASWLLQRVLGGFPDVGSKFIVVFGIQAFLDPFLILIVDCILQRYHNLGGDNPIADAAKLYWHFFLAEGSGLAGIFITVFLYAFTCFCAGAVLYMYFLRLHNNGRMLDVYWRLHGREDIFFVPYDLEVSNQELSYTARKAEQWRGEEGERRKVAVYDYVWEEETLEETVWDENGTEVTRLKEGQKEITTHVSIHSLHLDGLRELHRHFLRLPDGAIIEVFGDLAVAGMSKDLKNAVAEGLQNVEALLDSQHDLHKLSAGPSSGLTNSGFHLDEDDDHANKILADAGAGSPSG